MMIGAVERQQKLSEEDDRRWQQFVVWKTTSRCWQKRDEAERSNGAVFVFQAFFFFHLFFFVLLCLGLELFPEGPLQLRNRQSEGEGTV